MEVAKRHGRGLRNACSSREERQENGPDSEKVRLQQNTTDSSAVVLLVRKGPLGGTTSRLSRIKCLFSWFRRTHKPFLSGQPVGCPTFNRTLTRTESLCSLTLQPLLLWKNAREPRKKTRVFLFTEPLKSLEKKGKTHKKKQGNRKTKKKQKKKTKKENNKDWRVRVYVPFFSIDSEHFVLRCAKVTELLR